MNSNYTQLSYSQCGEDLIIARLVEYIKDKYNREIKYLDIGAFHPIHLSNTYYHYLNGATGILVEPNPTNNELFKRFRPLDLLINEGVGKYNGRLEYYIFNDDPALNTFSPEFRDKCIKREAILSETKEIIVFTLDQLISHYNINSIDLLSIDTEGTEFDILSEYSFRIKPKIICVETITPGGRTLPACIDLLKSKGYEFHASTHINTIMIDTNFFL